MPPQTVYYGTFLHCKSLTELDLLEQTVIGVDADGIIEFVERGVERANVETVTRDNGWDEFEVVVAPAAATATAAIAGEVQKGSVGFWFPGFVDTHIHASQFPNAGIFGKTTLLSWLETYTFPLEASLGSMPKARAVYSRCVSRTLANGTTTAAYYTTKHVPSTNLLADICLAVGQRAFVGRCGMDSDLQPEYYRDASVESAIADTKATIDHIRSIDPASRYVTPIITPRFAPSCSEELLREFGSLQRATNLPIQTHISENQNEIALVQKLFPQHGSYAQVYDACGLLTPKTVLAHCCHLSAAEISLIKARGATVSHCPVSNSFIGSGICPVRELLDEGITMGLGTDVSGGCSLSVLTAAREAAGVSRLRTALVPPGSVSEEEKDALKLSVEEALFLATRGGAACLGMEARVGAFEPGMEWDAQFVDLGPVVDEEGRGGQGNVEVWDWMGWDERIAKWLFCGDERNTKAVWVGGKLVSGRM